MKKKLEEEILSLVSSIKEEGKGDVEVVGE